MIGFLQFKQTEGLSPRTIETYSRDIKMWLEYHGDMEISKIRSQDVRKYLAYLLTEYTARRITVNNDVKLLPKTVRNVWIHVELIFPLVQ